MWGWHKHTHTQVRHIWLGIYAFHFEITILTSKTWETQAGGGWGEVSSCTYKPSEPLKEQPFNILNCLTLVPWNPATISMPRCSLAISWSNRLVKRTCVSLPVRKTLQGEPQQVTKMEVWFTDLQKGTQKSPSTTPSPSTNQQSKTEILSNQHLWLPKT